MKTHIMRLAVQDLTDSTIRLRALRMGRPLLWLLYQELLWRLYQAGGYLPSSPKALVDEVNFFTAGQIKEMLPLLAPTSGKVGGIKVGNGRIWNQRVLDELADEKAFSQEQALKGRKGGRARARALRLAAAINDDSRRKQEPSTGQAPVKRRSNSVKPAVSVSVSVPSSVSSSTEQRSVEAAASPAAFPSQHAADVYLRHYPKGSPPGPMFKALRPLVLKHGWEAVEPELDAYLLSTVIAYHNWTKFAAGFGTWSVQPRASPRAQARQDSMAAMVKGGLGAYAGESVDGRDDGARAGLPEPGADRDSSGSERPTLPAASGRPDR